MERLEPAVGHVDAVQHQAWGEELSDLLGVHDAKNEKNGRY